MQLFGEERRARKGEAAVRGQMDDIDRLVARRIREERKRAGLTQQDLAAVCGLSCQQISKVEGAIDRITVGNLHLMAERMGVMTDALFRERVTADDFVRAARSIPADDMARLDAAMRAFNGAQP